MRARKYFQWVILFVASMSMWGCATPAPPPPTPAERINSVAAKLAIELAANITPADSTPIRVGMIPLTDKSHQATTLSSTLQERLNSELFLTHRFKFVDKADMDKVLAELKQQGTTPDAYEPATLAAMHKLTAAQGLVTGAITDANSDFNLEIRLVDVSTGTQISVASGSIGKTGIAQRVGDADPVPMGPGRARDARLEPLVAPIALYPDPLLACVLAASTYPDEVKQAGAFINVNPFPTDDQIGGKGWDPSVQALAHYPVALTQMSADLEWTTSLGSAYTAAPDQVLAAVQDMRAQALAQKNLTDSSHQVVVQDGPTIAIQPTTPDVVYVPSYDPVLVYTAYNTSAPLTYSNEGRTRPSYACDWTDRVITTGPPQSGPYVYGSGHWRRDPDWRPNHDRNWRHDDHHGVVPHVAPDHYTMSPRVSLHGSEIADALKKGKPPTRPAPPPPPPAITSISPSRARTGSPDVRITVGGTNFPKNSVVLVNGKPVHTAFTSEKSLSATIPAVELRAVGIISVMVDLGSGKTNSQPFVVEKQVQQPPLHWYVVTDGKKSKLVQATSATEAVKLSGMRDGSAHPASPQEVNQMHHG